MAEFHVTKRFPFSKNIVTLSDCRLMAVASHLSDFISRKSEFGFPGRTFLTAEHSRPGGHPGQPDIVHFQIPDIAY